MKLAMGIIQGIIDAFGGLRPMARKLGVTHQIVYDWRKRGVIPGKRQKQVSALADELGIGLGSFKCPQCGRFYSDT